MLNGYTIALDVDSTMYPLITAISQIPGYEHVTYESVKAWQDLWPMCGGVGVAEGVWQKAMTKKAMIDGGIFPDVDKVLWNLVNHGAELVAITDRPPSTREAVDEWITHHNLPISELHCGHFPNKLRLFREVGADIVIDDKPLTMIRAHYDGIFTTALRIPYNEPVAEEHEIALADNWLGIEQLIYQHVGGQREWVA